MSSPLFPKVLGGGGGKSVAAQRRRNTEVGEELGSLPVLHTGERNQTALNDDIIRRKKGGRMKVRKGYYRCLRGGLLELGGGCF